MTHRSSRSAPRRSAPNRLATSSPPDVPTTPTAQVATTTGQADDAAAGHLRRRPRRRVWPLPVRALHSAPQPPKSLVGWYDIVTYGRCSSSTTSSEGPTRRQLAATLSTTCNIWRVVVSVVSTSSLHTAIHDTNTNQFTCQPKSSPESRCCGGRVRSRIARRQLRNGARRRQPGPGDHDHRLLLQPRLTPRLSSYSHPGRSSS